MGISNQSERADAYQDWINRIVVHVNECDEDLIFVEGYYKLYEYQLAQCATLAQANALKDKLEAFLATQPGNRARLAQVTAAAKDETS